MSRKKKIIIGVLVVVRRSRRAGDLEIRSRRWRFAGPVVVRQSTGHAKEGRADVVRLAELLGQVRLEPEVVARRPHALSGGERQRIAIARALALDPDLVVLDEAFTGLDTVTRRDLLDNLLAWRRRRGASLVVISHDQRLIAAIASRVLVLRRGKASGPDSAPKEPEVP